MFNRKAAAVRVACATTGVLLVINLLYRFPNNPLLSIRGSAIPYLEFFDGLEQYAIDAPLIKDHYKDKKAELLGATQEEFLFSKEYLENVLDIPEDTYNKLKQSHHGFVHGHMKRLLEQVKVDTFGKLRRSSSEWKLYHGSKGYVLIGGGKYSWLSYLVVKQIRAVGGVLPIEVFIPSRGEYEAKFCEEVLPKYNARCNVLELGLTEQLSQKFSLGGYQYKMLAMLTSDFENVMYMDSDLFPTKNVEYLFDSNLYQEAGLFLWPDHWARTTNPKFHEIAESPVLPNKVKHSPYDKARADRNGEPLKQLLEYTFADSNFHDFENALPDPTSEAGILVVNKTDRLKTLLLALYYNVYGPNFYYPLLTQGSAGEGDKETFIAAATVMHEHYFQTRKQFMWVGYHSKDEQKFVSKALGHYDPLTARASTAHNQALLVFMHCSYPKYYTDWMYNNHDLIYKDNVEHIRMYEGMYDNVGYDFDLRLQQLFVQGVCKGYYNNGVADTGAREEDEWAGNFLKYIGDDVETNNKRCAEVYLPHLQWLKDTTVYKDTNDFQKTHLKKEPAS